MTETELQEAYRKLKDMQQRTHAGIHELLNVLTIVQGEIDLAVTRARAAMEQFYGRFPDFLE